MAGRPGLADATLMNELPQKLQARSQRKAAKRDEKKRKLAESAFEALIELGYANTSLRDIAERSDLSLGMLLYYFDDKNELILSCVGTYKAAFVAHLRGSVSGQRATEDTIDAFATALARSIVHAAGSHKLWYDIRNQALFDGTFLSVVDEIETAMIEMVRLFLSQIGKDGGRDAEATYAMLDGLFRYYTQKHLQTGLSEAALTEVFRGLLTAIAERG